MLVLPAAKVQVTKEPFLCFCDTAYCKVCVCVCVSVTSDHSDDDVVFDDGSTSAAVTAQSVRWTHYQPKTWTTLLDQQCHEMLAFTFTFTFGAAAAAAVTTEMSVLFRRHYSTAIWRLQVNYCYPITRVNKKAMLSQGNREARPHPYSTRILGCSLWTRLATLWFQGAKTLS